MSTADDIINAAQRAKAKLESVIAHVDGMHATSESITDVGHGVGAERYINGGQEMSESVERARAHFQTCLDRNDEIIAEAQALKTAGPGATPTTASTDNGTATTEKPQYQVTTGADSTPNPIHATPAHTREPSRKIGDPVQPPHEISKDNDGGKSRFGRFGRALSRDADGLADFGSDLTESATATKADWKPVEPHEYQAITVVPQYQAPIHSGPQVAPEDIVGNTIIMTAVIVEGTSRLFKKLRGNDRGK